MSEYADLVVRDYSIYWFRNEINMNIAGALFSDLDIRITHNDIESETPIQYKYVTTVKKSKERLDALGYTLSQFKCIFDSRKVGAVDDCWLWHKIDDYDAYRSKSLETLSRISFKKWANAVRKLVVYQLQNGTIYPQDESTFKPSTICDHLIYSSLDNDEYSFMGLFCEDISPLYTIRLILDYCDDDEEISIDFTNLVGWHYDSIEELKIDGSFEKTIVLVEGTSDKTILEFSMEHIYPHLKDLYYFMDFEYAKKQKREAGVDAISNNIKTFISSKIKMKIIALYDNDAVGVFAKRKLCSLLDGIPSNMRIMNYPDTKMGKNYPTLTPSGKIVKDNINGRAHSIELYLPDSILKNGSGSFEVVFWKSLIEQTIEEKKERSYQGQIDNKEEIKKRFVEYKNSVERDATLFEQSEWSRMKQLLDEIINAFK